MQGDRGAASHVVMARNAACHQCRKAKRKCDGLRPLCTPCRNPMRRTLSVNCTYDQPAPGDPAQASSSRSGSIHSSDHDQAQAARKRSRGTTYDDPEEDSLAQMSTGDRTSAASADDLFWPDWPPDLPSLQTVEFCAEIFFRKVPTVNKMIHKATFMARLHLPPTSPHFPSQSLLHAMIVAAAPFIPGSTLRTAAFTPLRLRGGESSRGSNGMLPFLSSPNDLEGKEVTPVFQAWYRKRALERVAEQLEIGDRLVQCLQTLVIITHVDTLLPRAFAMWQELGACMRLAVALQMNETRNVPTDCFNRYSGRVLPPNPSPLERAEMDRTFWCAYIETENMNITGNWPSSLHADEITLELPVKQEIFDRGFEASLLVGTQTFRSPDFYTAHPAHMLDSLTLTVKASRLAQEIATCVREYARDSHTFRLYAQLAEPVIQDNYRSPLPLAALGAINDIVTIVHDLLGSSFDLTLLPVSCMMSWFSCARVLAQFNDAALKAGDLGAASAFYTDSQTLRTAILLYAQRHPFAMQVSHRLESLKQYQGEQGDLSRVYMNFHEELGDNRYQWTAPSSLPLGSTSSASSV
ncbi:hypothetical protein BD324DRAFT_680274 [Kockovaella imperatae]|uniref:Zn(2)-C6 fungal-type domain-containing protein n=1 Tax=Kockovaella imperatae TaxID=4999 RepID=A0A1Y1UKH5_9TREE|nr:hypothetical protein BD324DRAFT_680274 [Kockovaella imperatae]ORX38551.1 hypothetical protein BD324DRAFT_680274 [Kockovaella imperatae]